MANGTIPRTIPQIALQCVLAASAGALTRDALAKAHLVRAGAALQVVKPVPAREHSEAHRCSVPVMLRGRMQHMGSCRGRMKIFDKNEELTNNFTLANGGGSQYIHSAPLHWMVAASAGTS